MAEIEKKWYVLRAISGKEAKVKEYLEADLKNSDLGEYVSQVLIPTEKVYQVRNGKKIVKERSYLPGYVLVEAALVGEVAHHLRNTPNVIGFLGGSEKPVPLRQSEVNRILGTVDELQETGEELNIPYVVGETVKVTFGPFSGFSGIIEEVNSEKKGGVGQISVAVTGAAYKTPIPGLSKLGVVGQVLFSYGFLTYLAILLAIALAFFLSKTRKGLNLRAVGESPATADAAGINVTAYKYLATCIGGGISGLGGLYFVMEYSGGTWTNNGFGDRGWLAIALVIFALWKPVNAIWGSILFGGLYILYLYIPGLDRGAQEIFKALPYVVTIVVLVITSLRKKREYQPPQSLGLAYFREER